MLASEIITLAQDLTYTSNTQYVAATKGLRDLNILYKRLIAFINQEGNTDLFADIFWSTLNPWQVAYTKPQTQTVAKISGMNNMLGVFVNYSIPTVQTGTITTTLTSATWVGTTFTQNFTGGDNLLVWTALFMVVTVVSDTSMVITLLNNDAWLYAGQAFSRQASNYAKCKSERSSNLPYDLDSYYRFSQPATNPFYIMYDTEVNIYPAATSTTAFWLKIRATKDVPDLTLTDTPLLDDNYQYLLAFGLREYIYLSKWQLAEAANARQEYDNEVMKTLGIISDLQLEPYVYVLPNTFWLE